MISKLISPIAKYDPDDLINYAEKTKINSTSDIEEDCWDTILRITRMMKLADWIFGEEFEQEMKEEKEQFAKTTKT